MVDYDKIAKYYDFFYGDIYPYDAEVASLHRLFAQKGVRTVLDAPCGTGNHLMRLARLGYQCCGSDISDGMLDQAREKTADMEIDFFKCDIKRLHIPRCFDAIISLYGLPFALTARDPESSLESVLARFHRTLKGIYELLEPGGLLVFNILNPNAPLPLPGFGPWGEFNMQAKEDEDLRVQSFNSIHRHDGLINFKDVYLIQDGERLSMEILGYCIRLLSLEQLTESLRQNGFRIDGVYGYLSELLPFSEESWDITIAAVRE